MLQSGSVSIINHVEPLPEQDGERGYSSTSKHILRDESGEVVGIYGVGRDVTAMVELKEERESREMSRQLFEDVLEADLSENKMLRAEGLSG